MNWMTFGFSGDISTPSTGEGLVRQWALDVHARALWGKWMILRECLENGMEKNAISLEFKRIIIN
jgi:hypothetical protein